MVEDEYDDGLMLWGCGMGYITRGKLFLLVICMIFVILILTIPVFAIMLCYWYHRLVVNIWHKR